MRKMLFVLSMLITASFIFTGCEPAANTTTANKPANAANNAATTTASSATIEADLKKMVTDVGVALAKNDAAALEKIYGDNFMAVNPDGSVISRTDRLASMKSGETKFDSVAYDEVTVRSNAEGTGAVVIARATATGMVNGKKIEGPVRVTQVWSKTKDGWKMVSTQATTIAAAAPAKADDKAKDEAPKAPANK